MFDFKNIITKNNCSNKLFKNKMLIAFITNEICISLKNLTPQKKPTALVLNVRHFPIWTASPSSFIFLPLCFRPYISFFFFLYYTPRI